MQADMSTAVFAPRRAKVALTDVKEQARRLRPPVSSSRAGAVERAPILQIDQTGRGALSIPSSIRHRSSGRPAAGNDDGFAERLQIFLLADRMHRLQLCQQLVDQRTQPRPRLAVRERTLVL